MMAKRDILADAVRSVPYSLRLVALVLIFNGMFALVRSATLLIGNDVALDWRILNMVIGFGLLMKRQIWHIVACLSVITSAILHVKSIMTVLSEYQFWGAGGAIYFVVALALDIGMLYILLRHASSINSKNTKGNS